MHEDLKKYTTEELNIILKSVKQMIVIPIINKFNLNREQLIQMRNQLQTELKNR
jgi:hypothetical protein